MRVNVRLFAGLKEIVGAGAASVEVGEGATAADAWEALARLHPELWAHGGTLSYAVNRTVVPPQTPLAPGDEVAFLPPVSGGRGSAPEGEMVEITTEPIDAGALAERVREGSDGAIVTFAGVVRNSTDLGGEAEHLEYEAYPELALSKMREIIAQAQGRWPIGKVAMVHRLGRLGVGETSVAIAVAGPHRQAAFEACQFAIDRLKEVVPIWKKETTPTGASWR